MPRLSVVIPAFNEAHRVSETLQETSNYLEKQNYDYEIIVVDNASTDETNAVVHELFAQGVHKGSVIKELKKGKGAAVKTGIEHAEGEVVVFMDADNATPISEIEKFWPYFEEGYDVVIGSRYLEGSKVTHAQPLYRIVLSRAANLLIQLLAVPGIHDTQLGFKAFRKASARDIFHFVTLTGWGFDMEVLTVARIHKLKIKEVPVLWREFGGSHVPMKAYVQSLRDLMKIKLKAISGRYTELRQTKIA